MNTMPREGCLRTTSILPAVLALLLPAALLVSPAGAQSVPLSVVVHLEGLGDRTGTGDSWVGTRGEGRRLEGFAVNVSPPLAGIGLESMCHLQDIGDTPWKDAAELCGTRGQARRLEALALRLTGPRRDDYELRYRCHLEGIGDTPWMIAGELCGTRGQARRLEALFISLRARTPPAAATSPKRADTALAARAAAVADGLLAYYPLHKNAQDYGHEGLHGSASQPLRFTAGLYGGSADLRPSGALIYLPGLRVHADRFTISCWVYLEAQEAVPGIWADPLVGNLYVSPGDGGLAYLFEYERGGERRTLQLGQLGRLSGGRWHHVAVTYDHSRRTLAAYVDRELTSVKDLAGELQPTDVPRFVANGQTIGGLSGKGGMVSDVVFLKVAVDQGEVNFLGGLIRPQLPPSPGSEAAEALAKRSIGYRSCTPAWWSLVPVVGWIALQQAADCATRPAADPPAAAEVVRRIYDHLGLAPGSEIPPGHEVSRSDLGLDDSVRVHLDIGGEGPIRSDLSDLQTGFPDAINLQAPSAFGRGDRQTQEPKGPIPNLVRMERWDQAYPFAARFADYITMQNAPLDEWNVAEIARVIKANGEIALWVDRDHWQANIDALAHRLGGQVIYDDYDEFGGKAGFPKTTIVLNSKGEL